MQGGMFVPIPSDIPRVPYYSAKSHVLDLLQRWIIDGTLADGERISDGAVAEALGISRTPVREALLILETQGFIEVRRGRDTRVRPIRPQDLYDLYPPLAGLERTAAILAMPRMTEAHIAALKTTNEAFSHALREGRVYQAMELDETFHEMIVTVADNPYITSFVTLLQLHIRRLKYRFFAQALPGEQSVAEHAAIIHAFEQHDEQVLGAVMETNWLRPMRELGSRIGER